MRDDPEAGLWSHLEEGLEDNTPHVRTPQYLCGFIAGHNQFFL